MSDTLPFTVDSPPWFGDAQCRTADPGLFNPDTETGKRLARAQVYCAVCPVVAECLTWAVRRGESGYWGGTSTAQRDRMRRRRSRAKCPRCSVEQPVSFANLLLSGAVDPQQVCLSCGLSWKAASLPAPLDEAV